MGRRPPRLILVLVLVLAAGLVAAPGVSAEEADPLAPVVVDDEITLWPGQRGDIDVLRNDTDPGDDELSVCWLPVGSATPWPSTILVEDQSKYVGLPPGALKVVPGVRARGTHTIDYYVCSHTRLTPATLTVHVRPVAPVVVRTVSDAPGRLRVTNENDKRILFQATSLNRCRFDGGGWVGPHKTRTFAVHLSRIHWSASIGSYPYGIADQGTVRDIEPGDAPGDVTSHC